MATITSQQGKHKKKKTQNKFNRESRSTSRKFNLQKCCDEHVKCLSVLANKEANPPTEIYNTMHLQLRREMVKRMMSAMKDIFKSTDAKGTISSHCMVFNFVN